ncbi:transcriptional regulator [Bradyrhizobium sp. RDI18]|uniref:winged helix-turn-helix domain-containing protein n=1 Tax=Bradyrhizobium sp. RDI18 TaxID=3367400 RepID=UPI00371DBEA4
MAYLFGGMILDAERRELRSGAKLIPVEPQVFDILVYLIRNRDCVVSKEDLLSAVWDGRMVSDSAIAARINAARSVMTASSSAGSAPSSAEDSGSLAMSAKTQWRRGVHRLRRPPVRCRVVPRAVKKSHFAGPRTGLILPWHVSAKACLS